MKYIVYCTTNLKNGKIYVGVHKTIDPYKFDGYIGCGVRVPIKLDKPFKVKFPDTPLKHAINKYGYKNFYRTILATFDTEEGAYELEKSIVTEQFIKRGNTYNISVGGLKPTAITRKVNQYSITGIFIQTWETITSASNSIGIGIPDIVASCTNKQITAGGFVWRYYTTDDIEKQIPVRVKRLRGAPKIEYEILTKPKSYVQPRKPRRPKGEANIKAVVQYSKSGYRMKTFASTREAANHLGVGFRGIADCCRYYLKYPLHSGYQWRYAADNLESLPSIVEVPRTYFVGKILNGTIIETFDSIGKAAKSIGFAKAPTHMRNAITFEKEYKGYFWKYIKAEDMI